MNNAETINSFRKLILLAAVLTLASMLLTTCGSATTADAQEVVEQSCSKMDALTDLDVTTQMESYDSEEPPHNIQGKLNIEVSGDDWRSVMTLNDGNSVLGTIEVRRVNSASYYREDDGPWRTDLPIGDLAFPYASESLCPDLGPVKRVGEETINGVPVTRYAFSVDHDSELDALKAGDYDSYSYVAEDDWDVWLDSTGALVQTKQSIVYKSDEGDVVGNTELVSRISGIGEQNVITAPVTITP